MQHYFYELSDGLFEALKAPEVLLVGFGGEDSDFVRFNQCRVRQPGHVKQAYLQLSLINGKRQARMSLSLQNEKAVDQAQLSQALERLRARISDLPEDPHLLYATDVNNTEQLGQNKLPECLEAVDGFLSGGEGKDMVGIYAQGGIHAGFANSLGQKNWFSSYSFNLDWSFYHNADKAVKTGYADFEWSDRAFQRKLSSASEQLAVLAKPAKTIEPGKYPVYLAPSALAGIVEVLSWGGFSMRAHKTRTTPFLKMIEEDATLSPAVTLTENTAEGIAPDFQGQGYLRPPKVTLVEAGRYKDCLVSPRSAKEYGAAPNGASGGEAPQSLDMAAGDIPQAEVLSRLDTGIYINQTWYLNFSDQSACRITGMTRFATFWVENGRITAPLNVMRFDETAFRALGDNLIGLTRERDFLPDAGTYEARSTGSLRLPGALVKDFTLTL